MGDGDDKYTTGFVAENYAKRESLHQAFLMARVDEGKPLRVRRNLLQRRIHGIRESFGGYGAALSIPID